MSILCFWQISHCTWSTLLSGRVSQLGSRTNQRNPGVLHSLLPTDDSFQILHVGQKNRFTLVCPQIVCCQVSDCSRDKALHFNHPCSIGRRMAMLASSKPTHSGMSPELYSAQTYGPTRFAAARITPAISQRQLDLVSSHSGCPGRIQSISR
jgi:hypothetical protein